MYLVPRGSLFLGADTRLSCIRHALSEPAACPKPDSCRMCNAGPEEAQLQGAVDAMQEAAAAARAPFVWVDGPLVTAMRRGDMILIDELNLAEDAVLERLNR